MPAKKANSKTYNAYAVGGARNVKNLAQTRRAAVKLVRALRKVDDVFDGEEF